MATSFRDLFPFGVWQSNDTQQRWLLDFNENGCIWTERSSSGATLQRTVPLLKTATGWKIERPNDAEVLRFIGARDSIINDIMSRNPNPSFIELDVQDSSVQGKWNGLRWILDAGGNLVNIEQPGSTPNTKKDYSFVRQGDDNQYFTVAKGQLTFAQEGKEGGPYHSRWLHWPGGASGVTLGRGYDMKKRKSPEVLSDLREAGVSANLADQFAQGAGKSGDAASQFVTDNRTLLGNITPGQQKRLFEKVYNWYEQDVRRLCNKRDVVKEYGSVNFNTLNQQIWAVLVDLHFRGDYGPNARKIIQKHVAKNDLTKFKAAMEKSSNWSNVPLERFNARVAYLQ
jgi:hypothetical protein